jgi:hypothetical protein
MTESAQLDTTRLRAQSHAWGDTPTSQLRLVKESRTTFTRSSSYGSLPLVGFRVE